MVTFYGIVVRANADGSYDVEYQVDTTTTHISTCHITMYLCHNAFKQCISILVFFSIPIEVLLVPTEGSLVPIEVSLVPASVWPSLAFLVVGPSAHVT